MMWKITKKWQTDGGGRSYCMESTAVRLPQEDVISPVWHSLCDQHQVNDPPKNHQITKQLCILTFLDCFHVVLPHFFLCPSRLESMWNMAHFVYSKPFLTKPLTNKISQYFPIKLSSCYFHQDINTRCHREPSSQATHIGASSPFPRPGHFNL